MGVRGYVQVTHPTYGKQTLSSCVKDKAMQYLIAQGFEVCEYNDGDHWEIENTPSLMSEASYLVFDGDRFNDSLPEEIRENNYAKDLGNILLEGISACEKNHDSDIVIDWW